MEVMAMENNELKEKVRKQIQQKIAIANIRKELAKKNNYGRKVVFGISSACAVLLIGFGIYLGQNIPKEDLAIEWQINRPEEKSETKSSGEWRSDADITSNTYPLERWPESSQFLRQIQVPEGYLQTDCYAIFVRNSETQEYTVLHDYVLFYEKDEINRIRIACSELESPIRDYFLAGNEKISKIGEQEFSISQYQDNYAVIFQKNGLYLDIETRGITEEQLKVLLISLVNNGTEPAKEMQEGEDVTKEQIFNTQDTDFPEYYAGRYIDNNGNHVILLCQDYSKNRKEICEILGITESKTKFQIATYSYAYLLELQNKISQKMQKKELPFVSTSALLEDKNCIQVTVQTKDERELQKIKALDTKGGAIQIKYNEGLQLKTELFQEKE